MARTHTNLDNGTDARTAANSQTHKADGRGNANGRPNHMAQIYYANSSSRRNSPQPH